ncbi:protein TBATA isoform X2 [Scleropages formosus]|uniref:protein TBATA isoform X2 n=1 Tax=Scleropages formosus TaxID=113540 RepID=UPI0008785C4B|nr:protein TBATA isoform X2 [Scleropages formosus]
MEQSEKKDTKAPEDLALSTFRFRDPLKNKKGSEDALFRNPLPFIVGGARLPTRGGLRFGTLSHHSFFSRHNPHPNRVTHIQGLNGSPVCTVNDDWGGSVPLPPHPFIKSPVPWTFSGKSDTYIPVPYCGTNFRAAPLSETWREELRDLAAKVSLAASGGKEKKAKEHERRDSARETQYSARTGRIVPPSSQTSRSRCSQASLRHSRTRGRTPSQGLVYDQELLVLELLCQVLQTDSLSQVQQWLLFADAREKDLVMGLLQQALDPSVFHELRGLDQKESVAPRAHTLPAGPPGREDAPCGDDWNSGGPSGPFRGNRIS